MAEYTGIKEILSKFREKFVSKSMNEAVSNTTLTESGVSFTASRSGLVIVHFSKSGSGYTLSLFRNGTRVDQCSNFSGGSMSGTLVCLASKGDTIQISSDSDYENFTILSAVEQSI